MNESIRVLMVTTEYPPMQGGVGRYTANLTKSLRKAGLEVYVVCNEKGEGDRFGLSQYNENNSAVLLKAVQDLKPDLVHVQNEPGLYGLILDPIDPRKTTFNIDCFYYNKTNCYNISFSLHFQTMDESGYNNRKHLHCEKTCAINDEILEAPLKLLFIP